MTFVAIGALGLAAMVHTRADSWDSGVAAGAKLLPSLQRDMPRIATITLKQGANTVTIERKGEAWSLKDRGGYPVQGERVRALLVKLADAELIDRKTRNPERFALLELEDLSAKDANRVSSPSPTTRAGRSLTSSSASAASSSSGRQGRHLYAPAGRERHLARQHRDRRHPPSTSGPTR